MNLTSDVYTTIFLCAIAYFAKMKQKNAGKKEWGTVNPLD